MHLIPVVNKIFRYILKIAILLLLSSSLVWAFVLMDESSQTGPSDSQVIQDVRQSWQQLSDSKIQLNSVYVDERDVMAADRVRFEVSLVYQVNNEKSDRQEKHSMIYRLFDDQWREHRY